MSLHESDPIREAITLELTSPLIPEPRRVESAPTSQSNSVFSRIGEALCAALVVGAGLALAALLLGIQFSEYDDEGYALISIAHYLKTGHLYSDTYSQYGPFFFIAGEFCFRLLRIPLNHDGGRLVTFVAWAAAALLGGWTVHRATGPIPLGAAACGSLFVLASALANEPIHPQYIVLVISILAAHLSLSRRCGWSAFAFGAMGMALLLTKVNVGVFFFFALLLATLIATPHGRWQTRAMRGVLCVVVALPFILMRSHLALYGPLCLTVTAAILAVGLAASRADLRFRLPVLDARRCLAGAASIAIPVVGWVMLRGSSPADLFHGLVLWPSRQAGTFPLTLHPSAIRTLWTLLAPTGSLLLCLRLTRRRPERFRDASGALCFAAGSIALAFTVAHRPDVVIAFLPIGILPLVFNRLSGRAIFGPALPDGLGRHRFPASLSRGWKPGFNRRGARTHLGRNLRRRRARRLLTVARAPSFVVGGAGPGGRRCRHPLCRIYRGGTGPAAVPPYLPRLPPPRGTSAAPTPGAGRHLPLSGRKYPAEL